MSSPFDLLADSYVARWSDAPEGRGQRDEVWREIRGLWGDGDRVLDLGCGTGDDALFLRSLGVRVEGMDASERMVEIARARGVDARVGRMESAGGAYDGVLSNFGALNCVAGLEGVLRIDARVLALCVMGRFSWRETLRYLREGAFGKAARRWSGRAVWRGMEIRYWSAREMRSAFEPRYTLARRVKIGGGDHILYIFKRGAR